MDGRRHPLFIADALLIEPIEKEFKHLTTFPDIEFSGAAQGGGFAGEVGHLIRLRMNSPISATDCRASGRNGTKA